MISIDSSLHTRAREATRRCKKCSRDLEIDHFQEYLGRGKIRRRHTCRDCMRSYLAEWKRRNRATQYLERATMLRAVVTRMVGSGITRADLAERAGVSDRTVYRILADSEDVVRFQQPTEDKVLCLFMLMQEVA